MIRKYLAIGLVAIVALAGVVVSGAQSKTAPAAPAAPVIVVETVKGIFEIETLPDAPKAVAHILVLVRRGFYRGLRFHWVQPGVIQVGDPLTRDMSKQDKWGTGGSGERVGVAEVSKRSFVRGTVGLFYRPGFDVETSDSQFFVIKIANPALDGKYIMIGRVTKGMDVVDKIEKPDAVTMMYVKGEARK
jgi:cyclophilin family peptidyl-prolyl cis-trans isomerase